MQTFVNHSIKCEISETCAIYSNSISGNYLASRKIDSEEDKENLLLELTKSGYIELFVRR